jgi:hypothetical protein
LQEEGAVGSSIEHFCCGTLMSRVKGVEYRMAQQGWRADWVEVLGGLGA